MMIRKLIVEDKKRYRKMSVFGKRYWFFFSLRLQEGKKNKFLCKMLGLIRRFSLRGTGCDIPFFKCGKGLLIPHLSGIVIHANTEIGKNATIFQQVTIGLNDLKSNRIAPKIGDNAYIGAGAKIIGNITIGDNVKIGANAVVTKDIPSNSTVIEFNKIIKTK